MADVVLGNQYDLNRDLWKQIATPTDKTIDLQLASLGAWLSYHYNKNDYFMLYCRELHDFIIFFFKNQNYTKFTKELKECLETRGRILSIEYSHGSDYYECWVRQYEDDEPRMYAFFNCTDWIVKV